MHEAIAHLAALFPSCFRQPCEPLKIGIHNDIIARHPELRPSVLANALKAYTRSLGYLETIKAGATGIDLEGNPAGRVARREQAKIASLHKHSKGFGQGARYKTKSLVETKDHCRFCL